MKTLSISIFSAFVFSIVLMLSGAVMAGDASSAPIEKLISEMADKPEQHQAIANYYKDKIAEAKKELATHVKMRKAYHSGSEKKSNSTAGMRKHCDRLIKNAESSIKAYEGLMAEHEAKARP